MAFRLFGKTAVKAGAETVEEVGSTLAIRGGRDTLKSGMREGAQNAAQKALANRFRDSIVDTAAEGMSRALKESGFQPAVTQGKGAWKTVLAKSKVVQGAAAAAIVATGVATAVAVGKGGDDLLEGAGDVMSGTGTLMEYAPLAIGAGVAIVGIYYLTSS